MVQGTDIPVCAKTIAYVARYATSHLNLKDLLNLGVVCMKSAQTKIELDISQETPALEANAYPTSIIINECQTTTGL